MIPVLFIVDQSVTSYHFQLFDKVNIKKHVANRCISIYHDPLPSAHILQLGLMRHSAMSVL